MEIFAKQLRKRMDALELSQAEVARRCGLTERRFGHYATGTREPDLATLVKIATTLGVTPNDLLGAGSNEQTSAGEAEKLRDAIQTVSGVLDEERLNLALGLINVLVEQGAKRPKRRSRKKL